ncbi:MAG TPA: hypothetical protein ENJ68_00745 [Devosia sp.]|nr:hypothetical protein [Devosia sp.]
MTERFARTLIVGGTGMLAQVSEALSQASGHLTLAARNPSPLAHRLRADALPLDWNEHAATRAALASLPPQDLIIAWLHRQGEWMHPLLLDKRTPTGRMIRLFSSRSSREIVERHARLEENALRKGEQHVVLGWMNRAGTSRWLTDEEICDSVREAVDFPDKALIIAGSLEPPLPL